MGFPESAVAVRGEGDAGKAGDTPQQIGGKEPVRHLDLPQVGADPTAVPDDGAFIRMKGVKFPGIRIRSPVDAVQSENRSGNEGSDEKPGGRT